MRALFHLTKLLCIVLASHALADDEDLNCGTKNYWPNGKTKTAIECNSARTKLRITEFWKNGHLSYERILEKDASDIHRLFWPNGKLAYERDALLGKHTLCIPGDDDGRLYLEDGRVWSEENDLSPMPLVNRYFPDGDLTLASKHSNLEIRGQYRRGQRVGIWSKGGDGLGWTGSYNAGLREGAWHTTGDSETDTSGNYSHGLRQGDWTEMFSGATTAQGAYSNGRKTGPWMEREVGLEGCSNDPAVVAHSEKHEIYLNGVLEGEALYLDGFGNTLAKGAYVHGHKDGLWTYCDGDGCEEGMVKDDLKTGSWTGQQKNGFTLAGEYVSSKKQGIWTRSLGGVAIERQTYEADQLKATEPVPLSSDFLSKAQKNSEFSGKIKRVFKKNPFGLDPDAFYFFPENWHPTRSDGSRLPDRLDLILGALDYGYSNVPYGLVENDGRGSATGLRKGDCFELKKVGAFKWGSEPGKVGGSGPRRKLLGLAGTHDGGCIVGDPNTGVNYLISAAGELTAASRQSESSWHAFGAEENASLQKHGEYDYEIGVSLGRGGETTMYAFNVSKTATSADKFYPHDLFYSFSKLDDQLAMGPFGLVTSYREQSIGQASDYFEVAFYSETVSADGKIYYIRYTDKGVELYRYDINWSCIDLAEKSLFPAKP